MARGEVPLGNAIAAGYTAHRAGWLLAECPHEPSHTRRLWRAGWMAREESYLRVSRFTGLRIPKGQ